MTEPESAVRDNAQTTKLGRLTAHSAKVVIDDRQVYSVFQPIVDLTTGDYFAHEALLRCDVPELASPLRLIEVAIEESAMGELGREARRTAFGSWRSGALFVNIHPDEFDDGFLSRPDDPMFAHSGDVYVEITEAAPLERYRFCKSTIAELRRRGVKLAIDDFGAGYSNVTSIVELAPEIVKLDRLLITGVAIGSRQHSLIRSLVSLCADLGAEVVAEGIETPQDLDAIVAAGVRYAQGYFWGRPKRNE